MLTSSWNIKTHFWHRIWNIQNKSVQNIYTFDYLTLLYKKLHVFKRICDTFGRLLDSLILTERYIYISGKIMNVRLWTNVPPKVFESSVLGGYSSEFNIIFFIRKHSFWIVEIRCLNSVLNSHSKVIWFEVKILMVIEIYFQAWQTPEIWKILVKSWFLETKVIISKSLRKLWHLKFSQKLK